MNQIVNRLPMLLAALMCVALTPRLAPSQEVESPQAEGQTTISGTVVSSSRNVLVVRTDRGVHNVFIYDRYSQKPADNIPVGSTVRVISTPSDEPGVRLATHVTVSSAASEGQPKQPTEPVPASVRRLEDDIERQARRYGMGFRGGVGLDPEVLLVGVHARLGPFFNRNFSFRPNIEYGWGEVTKLVTINLEGIYRLPFTPRLGRWSAYAGAGPSLVFSHQNFEDNGVDFGDFDFDGGLNVLAGMEFRSGLFFEAKTTVYASPHLRLIVGYTF
jgi:hypothetical protein